MKLRTKFIELITHLTSGAASRDILETAVMKRSLKHLPAVIMWAVSRRSASWCRCCAVLTLTALQRWLRKDKNRGMCFILFCLLTAWTQPRFFSYLSPVFNRALTIGLWLQYCTMASSATLACWCMKAFTASASFSRRARPVPSASVSMAFWRFTYRSAKVFIAAQATAECRFFTCIVRKRHHQSRLQHSHS